MNRSKKYAIMLTPSYKDMCDAVREKLKDNIKAKSADMPERILSIPTEINRELPKVDYSANFFIENNLYEYKSVKSGNSITGPYVPDLPISLYGWQTKDCQYPSFPCILTRDLDLYPITDGIDNFRLSIDNDYNIRFNEYTGERWAQVYIPARLYNGQVIYISPACFYDKAVESFQVSSDSEYFSAKDGVLLNKDQTRIISVPNGIGDSYILPDTITSIALGALYDNGITQSLTLNNNILSVSGYNFELWQSSHRNVYIESIDGFIQSSFTSSRYAHSGSPVSSGTLYLNGVRVTNLIIPEGIEYIGNGFEGSVQLSSISIPSTIKNIHDSAFYGNFNLKKVYITNLESWCHINFPDQYSNPLCYQAQLFLNEQQIISLEIPDTIREIKDYSFYQCSSIKNIHLPSSIEKINKYSFYWCANLQSLHLTSSINSIEEYAFYQCNNLKEIYFDGTVNQWNALNIKTGNDPLKKAKLIASGQAGPNAFWTLNGTELTIKGSGGLYDYNENNPAPWGTEPISVQIDQGITKIGDYSFYNCRKLQTAILPDSIIYIGDYAFYNCSKIQSLNIPQNSLYIGDYAFYNCDLQEFTWPQNILEIPTGVLANNSSLKSITITNSLTSIGNMAFYNCGSLANFDMPSTVSYIGDQAFTNCIGIKEITVPSGVREINSYTFSNTGIQQISLPSSVKIIKEHGFSNCGSLIEIDLTSVDNIGFYAFGGCQNLVSVELSDLLQELPKYAFAQCRSLQNINIPVNIKKIDDYAFSYCNRITQVTLPDTLEYFSGFTGCTGLQSINLPTSVNTIGEGALQQTNITNINLPPNITKIEASAFYGCSKLTNIALSPNIAYIGDYCFQNCTSLASIAFNFKLESIGNYAFANCSSLSSINLPNKLSIIGNYAFSQCEQLSYVNIEWSNQLKSIKKGVFYNCRELTSIILPDSIVSIEEQSFYNCLKLQQINIPDSTNSIGRYAFQGCSSLELDISSNIVNIGSGAFNKVKKIKIIINQNFIKTDNQFNGIVDLEVVIEEGTQALQPLLFYQVKSLTSIELPESLKIIGEHAFSYCSGLKQIVLPYQIEAIKEYTFYYCSSLQNISFYNSIKNIEQKAFDRCDNLSTVYFYGTEQQWKDIHIDSGNDKLLEAQIIYQ